MSTNVTAPLVSLAIPTYNGARRFLRQTLASAVAQTYENIEIVVCDNASPDDPTDVVSEFSDPRVRLIRHMTSLGANGNFNFGIQESKGTYTLLLHDDDLIDPDFVSVCMERAAGSEKHSFIRTGVRFIDSNGSVLRERRNVVDAHNLAAMYRAWLKGTSPWYYCNTLFNRAALLETGGFHSIGNQLEDGFAVVRLASRGDWIDIPDVKASFRETPEQRTFHVSVKEWCQDYRALLDIMCEQVGDSTDYFRLEAKKCFGRRCLKRAEARPTAIRRMMAGMIVARYFGPRHFTWGRLERVLSKAFDQ